MRLQHEHALPLWPHRLKAPSAPGREPAGHAHQPVLSQGRFRLIPMIAVLIVVWIVLELLTGGLFLSARNLTNLSGQVAITAVLVGRRGAAHGAGLYRPVARARPSPPRRWSRRSPATVYGFGFWPTVFITIGFGLMLGFWHAYWVAWMPCAVRSS